MKLDPNQLSPHLLQTMVDLRRLRAEQRASFSVQELAELLGLEVNEVRVMHQQVTKLRPAPLFASPDRILHPAAELVVALNARSQPKPVDELPSLDESLARDADRLLKLIATAPMQQSPSPSEDFGNRGGEHPRSWQIMWLVLGTIVFSIVGIAIFMGH